MNSPIYTLRISEAYRDLESSPEGLPASEVEARQGLYGSNLLSEQPKRPLWKRLLAHLIHPMALILWLAGGLAFVVREPTLGIVIWAVVVANAGFSFWREHRAEQAMEALRGLLPAYARVVRAGSESRVPTSELVPGDVLLLAEGDNIPADARVVEEYGLRTNNAVLTGEAVPSRKTADASLREGISELERPNLVFAGTSVVSGTGRALIYATGMLTQFGRIAHLTQAVEEGPSPLQTEMVRMTRIISLVAIFLGGITFLIASFDVGMPLIDAFVFALGVLVATIPEGLPATVTLSLAMAGQRLAQQGVFVKKLSVLETLGTVSVICTDKSGTLTQNQMTVRQVWVGGQNLRVSGVGYDPRGVFTPRPDGSPLAGDLQALLAAATLCNNSRLSSPSPEQPQWSGLGDQTELALRVAALKGGIDEEVLSQELPRIHELPFDARRKRMSTVHRDVNSRREAEYSKPNRVQQSSLAFVKGAPREVLQLCTHILMEGEIRPLDEHLRADIVAAIDEYARNALRVLALARRELPARNGGYTIERIEHDLTFLGLMAMMDPPRPEVAQAIERCQRAGIRMVMITGDYGLTAESLARRIGLLKSRNPLILTGADLEGMSDAEVQAVLEKETLFARMAPEHKLRLVAAFQARGEVVAVTGDGVNDAPALRKADVGVAMGIIGTDVAKESADLVLTDDNFGAIASAVEEGRAVFDNLRKFVTYIFSSNVPEVLPFILTSMTGIPLALKVQQILAIDMGTDLFPALALGTEKPEPDVMKRPPRPRNQRLLDRHVLTRAFLWLGMIEALLCYTGFFLVLWIANGFSLPHVGFLGLDNPNFEPYALAVTVFYAGVVLAQVGNVFACRTEKARGRQLGWLNNRLLLLGVAVEIGLILLLVYVPPLARTFGLVSLPPLIWGWLALYAPVIYGLDWIRKAIVRRFSTQEVL